MAQLSISNVVLEASKVALGTSFKIYGDNVYTVSTDFITWDSSHSYTLSGIAKTFGVRASEPIDEKGTVGFKCGQGAISAYDFGLLYNVLVAMTTAKVEMGSTFPIESTNIAGTSLKSLWLGNNGIVYSTRKNFIAAIPTQSVKSVCKHEKVPVNNFCGKDKYTLELEGRNFCLMTTAGEMFSLIPIPECVSKTFAKYINPVVENTFHSEWDNNSGLGSLISSADDKSNCMETLEKYKQSNDLGAIVRRDDLVVDLTTRYEDKDNFFGSICYTDNGEIVVPVNYRNGLFIYHPWFADHNVDASDIKVDTKAKFQDFYNITDGCNNILRYADTVSARPLTPAQLDMQMFSRIKDAFFDMKLSRLPIKSSFGRVVIPEEILIQEISGGAGESLFCIVPVGIIGSKVIHITDTGSVHSMNPIGWDLTSMMFDITEVI